MNCKTLIWGGLLLAALPLFATGCGGDGSTGGGIFGGSNQSAVTPLSPSSPNLTSGTTSGSLTPNAAPLSSPTGGAQAGAVSGPSPTSENVPNGSLAPLAGTYVGAWKPLPSAASTDAENAPPAKSAPPAGGAVTLKLTYPKRAGKPHLGDVSGTWLEPALGGLGRIAGTVDKIGLPNDPNAVHVVAKITFPGGRSRPFVAELAEAAVGYLGGTVGDDTVSLKKTR